MVMSGCAVLVVDDNAELLASYQRGFRSAGCAVQTALTTAAALRLAEAHAPALVVTDLRIGADWGIDLVRVLKASHPDMQIVIVSGYLSVASAVDAMRAGASYVLQKPVTATQILERLARAARPVQFAAEPTPTLDQVQRDHILRVFSECGGNVSRTARSLGLHRQSLQRYLRRHATA